jgi:hypothetical protein
MENATAHDPFDLTRLIAQGWKEYRHNFVAIAVVVLLISVPVNIFLSLVPPYFINGHGLWDAWIIRLLSAFKILVFNGLIAMAVAGIIDTSRRGVSVSWSDSLRQALSRSGAALSLGPLLVVLAMGMLLLLLVPRLGEAVCYALFTFYFFSVSLRNRSGMAAISYAWELFRGQSGQVFWCQFVFFLFTAVFTAGLLPLLLVFPRIAPVAIGFNAILDLFLACPLAMSTLFFIQLDAVQKKRGVDADC